ncbi:hypothetical protein QFC22_004731 [Naganishia vaughanmartiniae]|uniref:Uncharacterized protein n=1 Tax=Naganishia vaughanmartiniae TaxID=1424756 RepID=A0ACC2WZQ8_9TREE|nr:hypothetical protein QFC22_004731 [Naganishia vaughanmartiniae]
MHFDEPYTSSHPDREKDVDEVLQIANVFTNVSKGQVAKTADLQSAFRTTDIPQIVSEILLKGELQVGEKERNHALGNLWKEVAGLVADKVVDPGTKRPYSVSMIEKAMQEVHFNVRADKPAKSQALECIKLLLEKSPLPIERARMKVRLTMPTKDGKRLKDRVLASAESVEENEMTMEEWEVVSPTSSSSFPYSLPHKTKSQHNTLRARQIMLIDPGQFRVLNELLESETKGRGRMESMGYAAVTTEEKLE